MNIRILGTRGEIKPSSPYHAKKSGILVDNEILFDIGEEIFLKQNPKYILLTHLHPDHAFFVRTPKKIVKNINIPIYAPQSYSRNIDVKKLISTKKFGSHIITPIPTHHSLKVSSQAYLIKKGKEKILYTGDLVWLNKEHYHKLKNLDLVITEASYYRKGGLILRDRISGKIYGHTGIPNLLQLFSKFTTHVLFVHFGSWFYEDTQEAKKKLLKLGKKYGITSLIGYDGMEINSENFCSS